MALNLLPILLNSEKKQKAFRMQCRESLTPDGLVVGLPAGIDNNSHRIHSTEGIHRHHVHGIMYLETKGSV